LPDVAQLHVVTVQPFRCRTSNAETLWRTTIERNPSSSMAYNNLGNVLLRSGRMDDAPIQFGVFSKACG
jgi:hypothetical protein